VVAGIRPTLFYAPMLAVLPIVSSCLNSVYSWDPGCLGEQYSFTRHGLPRLKVSMGWFPSRYYQYASFRVHDDGFTAFSRYGPLEPPLFCGRMAADDLSRLGALWDPTTVSAAQEEPCRGGFAFWTEGLAPACPETVEKFLRNDWAPRGEVDRVPLFRLEWYELPDFGERRFFYWDLESPLPPVIEDAVAETVKMVCAESKIFQRRFHRHLPELAESFGC